MNTDLPPFGPEDMEQKVTALLLGELPPLEAEAVRAAISSDPELARLHSRLAKTLELVREAVAEPTQPSAAISPPRLSPERRERLLQTLRTPAQPGLSSPARVIPVSFPENASTARSESIWLAAAACLVAMLGLALLSFTWSTPGSFASRDLSSSEAAVKARGLSTGAGGAAHPGGSAGNDAHSERDLLAAAESPRPEIEGVEINPAPPVPQPTGALAYELAPLPEEPAVESEETRLSSYQKQAPSQAPSEMGESLGRFVTGAESAWPYSLPDTGDTPVADDAQTRFYFRRSGAADTPARIEAEQEVSAGAPASRLGLPQLHAPQRGRQDGEGFGGGGTGASQLSLANARDFAAGGAAGASALDAKAGEDVAGSSNSPRDESRRVRLAQESLAIPGAAGRSIEAEGRSALRRLRRSQDRLEAQAGDSVLALEAPKMAASSPATTPELALKQERLAAEDNEILLRERAALPVQLEVSTADSRFSTFSLNVTDVSFKLADASLSRGSLPDPASLRSEEFLNAFSYRDPEPSPGMPISLAWERARFPWAHRRDVLRLALQTAALGREAGRPLNLVLLLDRSGSMERADRVEIVREALSTLVAQLHANDRISLLTFSRVPRLWVDGLPGDRAAELVRTAAELTPEGGTHIESALRTGYEVALKHFLVNGINRVVLLTDGAANLGELNPQALQTIVKEHRARGVALDAFGIGWEGYNDNLLEVLTRNGDGRYGFINSPDEAGPQFASRLAGALRVAASDVKVQVEFNPQRVTSWRQIGYAQHQLTKEQFRDNTVDAAELGARESGNALYVLETNPDGEGPLGTVRVRYRIPDTGEYTEHSWTLSYSGSAPDLDSASPALKLATAAGVFSEWLAGSPFTADVTAARLLSLLSGVPEHFHPDPRPARLVQMIREAGAIRGM